MRELRPAAVEYERLLEAATAGAANTSSAKRSSRSATKGSSAARRPASARKGRVSKASRSAKPDITPARRAPARGARQLAVVAALEHGSHTVSELVVVTALSPASVRESLRNLTRRGLVGKAVRDGRPAYELASASG
jgi:hypothetical protein